MHRSSWLKWTMFFVAYVVTLLVVTRPDKGKLHKEITKPTEKSKIYVGGQEVFKKLFKVAKEEESGTSCRSCWDVRVKNGTTSLVHRKANYTGPSLKAVMSNFMALSHRVPRCRRPGRRHRGSFKICKQGCSTITVNHLHVKMRWENGTVEKFHLPHFNGRGCLEDLPRGDLTFDPLTANGCFAVKTEFWEDAWRHAVTDFKGKVTVKVNGTNLVCACHKNWCNGRSFKAIRNAVHFNKKRQGALVVVP